VLFVDAIATSGQKASPICIDVDPAVAAIEKLAKVPWTEFAPAQVRGIWPVDPETPVCECKACSISESMEAINRCCETCEIVPDLAFNDWSDPEKPRLVEIAVFVCNHDLASTLRITRRIVDAIRPPKDSLILGEPDWTVASVGDHSRQSYRWQSPAGPVSLWVHLYKSNGGWRVHLRHFECKPRETSGVLTIDTDTKLNLIHVDRDDPWRISVDYLTECHYLDACCMESELRHIWPIFRNEAEKSDKRIVTINPTDCSRGSTGYYFTSYYFTKESNGEWRNNFHCKKNYMLR
jgi:hypothetical protein